MIQEVDQVDELLRPCRVASSQESLALALEQLSESIPRLKEKERVEVASFLVQDLVVIGSSSHMVEKLDQCLEACGLKVALESACIPALLEAAVSKHHGDAPPVSMQTTLRMVRRLFLTLPEKSVDCKEHLLIQLIHDYNSNQNGVPVGVLKQSSSSVDDLVTTVLLLPVQIAAACHSQQLMLPTWAIKNRFCPRLVQCATVAAISCSSRNLPTNYLVALVQKMSRFGGSTDVALGWYHCFSQQVDAKDEVVFSQLVLQLLKSIPSPRECAKLMRSVLQHLVSVVQEPQDWKVSSQQQLVPYLLLTCRPILEASRDVQEEFVKIAVLSLVQSSSLVSDRIVPYSLALLLDACQDQELVEDSDDSDDSVADNDVEHSTCLWRCTLQVAASWCQSVYVQRTDVAAQRHATRFLQDALSLLPLEEMDLVSSRLVSNLLGGVTVRLESSVMDIRLDGMRVAEQLAVPLGQTLRFDELDGERQETISRDASTDSGTKTEATETLLTTTTSGTKASRPPTSSSKVKKSRTKTKEIDPDEEYVSDDDDDVSASSIEDEDGEGLLEEQNDDDSIWDDDDDLIPYDLEDDEEDLRETPRPLYLRDCLALLRAGENEDTAYSQHETALQEVAKLVRTHPADLADFAVPLSHQLLHMENKFNLADFGKLRQAGLCALAVEEPWPVGQCLIEELFGGVALATRMEVLHTLEEAAYELSGAQALKEARETRKIRDAEFESAPRIAGKRRLVKDEPSNEDTELATHVGRAVNSVEARTRRWGHARRQNKQITVSNRFGPVAPMLFYSMLDGFMKSKDESSIWSGANGSRLLASFLVTLAVFVECSGNHSGTSVLAKDLFDLAWSFRDVEAAEVRTAVLVAIANSVSFLQDQSLMSVLYGDGMESLPDFLRRTALEDSDKNCRRLADVLSKNIVRAIGALQGGQGALSSIEMTPSPR